MKVGAHPLLVAVALGLLGPNALAAESDRNLDGEDERSGPCEGCDCGAGPCAAEEMDPVAVDPNDAWSVGFVPDAELGMSSGELGFVMTDLPDALAAEAMLVLS